MNADWVKKLLLEKFSQLLCAIDSVDEDNGLIEGEGVKQVGQFFKLFVLGYFDATSGI